jgi:hypothetical protein
MRSTRLVSFNIGVPAGLQEVLDTMLAKDPALRFPTPGQAARELRQLLVTSSLPAPAGPRLSAGSKKTGILVLC